MSFSERPNDDPDFQSLVRYSTPVLMEQDPEKTDASTAMPIKLPKPDSSMLDSKRETEEILNLILPPRCWEEDGQMWQQAVSTIPATRQDVINLTENLDLRLQERQARETGLCAIRRELYTQCFDELIRQVTISLPERGFLLLRIRDEANMSIETLETLYSSSVAFGMRKAVQVNEEMEMLSEGVKMLETENKKTQETITELQLKLEQFDVRSAEIRGNESKRFADDLDFLKKTNAQLKSQLEGILHPRK